MTDIAHPSKTFAEVADAIAALGGAEEIITEYPERLWHFSTENVATIQPRDVRAVILEAEDMSAKTYPLGRTDCTSREVTVDLSIVPLWVQPTGAHDAYSGPVWVQYNGGVFVNIVPEPTVNTYAPDVYGWDDPLTPIPAWVLGPNYQIGDQRMHSGNLWENRRANNNQGFAPGTVGSGWMQKSPLPAPWYNLGNEGWPLGATATDAGHLWLNDVANNTFQPGTSGWTDLGVYTG